MADLKPHPFVLDSYQKAEAAGTTKHLFHMLIASWEF